MERPNSFPKLLGLGFSGVYQYFDKNGKILYVGKAKNLKRHVNSYFNKTLDNNRTRVMVRKIC